MELQLLNVYMFVRLLLNRNHSTNTVKRLAKEEIFPVKRLNRARLEGRITSFSYIE